MLHGKGHNAFTLIELLVVMGIIVLLIALALPAFSFITGSRSAEAATNNLASVLGIGRANAIALQTTQGVAIVHDENSDRAVAVLVEVRSAVLDVYVAGNPTPPGGAPAMTIPYVYGQYVLYSNGKNYVCIQDYIDTGADPQTKPDYNPSNYWREMRAVANANGASILEIKAGGEFSVLPKGIDVRSVGNQFRYTNVTPYSRYFSPAVFLFDANGQLVSTQVAIDPNGILGSRFDSNKTVPALSAAPANTPVQCYSGIGLAVIDTQQYTNATSTLSVIDTQAWLDQNATLAMVNRYNGTLVKGE